MNIFYPDKNLNIKNVFKKIFNHNKYFNILKKTKCLKIYFVLYYVEVT